MEILFEWQNKLKKLIWGPDTKALPPLQAMFITVARFVYIAVRDLLFDSQLSLRAMSLVYTTLLSIVPLIAVSISVLKGFGAQTYIETTLPTLLEPLGARGKDVSDTIIGFVEGIHSGILGSLGLALLLYTVISLMQKIEHAFNYTWHVSEERSFARRFSDYLSVILIGPVLMFSAMGLTASVTSSTLYKTLSSYSFFSFMFGTLSHLLPYLLIILAFTMIYIFVPNTKVKFKSALVGATVAGVAWQTVGWLFASFISSANYTAIYSAFAALFFFMIWLYISWSILLTGASIAFYYQHPEYRSRQRKEFRFSNRMKEKLALAVMAQIITHYYTKREPWSLQGLAHYLNVASDSLHSIIQCLLKQGLLIRTDADPTQFIPAQAPESLSVLEVLRAVREFEEDEFINMQRIPHSARVEELFESYQDAAMRSMSGKTLKDLVDFDDSAYTIPKVKVD